MTNNPTEEIYLKLQSAFQKFNDRLFGSTLSNCVITLRANKRTAGYFYKNRFGSKASESLCHEIALNPEWFGVTENIDIYQTLAHEMTHQWQFEYGTPSRAGYHNEEWSEKMQSIGLMPSHNGRQGGKKTGQNMSDYVIKGGLLEQSYNELVNENCIVTWYDRIILSSNIAEPIKAKIEEEIKQIQLDGGDINKLKEKEMIITVLSKIEIIKSTPAGNNAEKNKRKYTCRGCKSNVWGKPNLNLICGDCLRKYELNEI
ncbi:MULTISPECIES: SprT-like domain-containing protein [unclassified Acinetobacter]|uniref:SprT-like domain-containing protein n=1 Tax=unclassified Acinetobacter TaxID=196816 RepID=UPI0015D0D416|nr:MULTISPECIES: SprT-like domain-containing protein [unclassified Acinetobacter]UUS62508.1 SprT-like domain-containing protein [Acinetobacter sp. YH16056_T]